MTEPTVILRSFAAPELPTVESLIRTDVCAVQDRVEPTTSARTTVRERSLYAKLAPAIVISLPPLVGPLGGFTKEMTAESKLKAAVEVPRRE
jgi:hypothetical protein